MTSLCKRAIYWLEDTLGGSGKSEFSGSENSFLYLGKTFYLGDEIILRFSFFNFR